MVCSSLMWFCQSPIELCVGQPIRSLELSKISWVPEVVFSSDSWDEALEQLRVKSKTSLVPMSLADKKMMLNPPETEGQYVVFFLKMVEED